MFLNPFCAPRTFFARHLTFLTFLLVALALSFPARAQTVDIHTVDAGLTGTLGLYTSHAIVGGKPAISYYDHSNGDLKFARNNAVDGSGTWMTVTVDSEGSVGEYTSLAIVDGKPAISYLDGTNGDLKFARNSEVEGSGTWTTVTVDSEGNVGAYTSLAAVDGKPAISYWDVTNDDLKFARNSQVDGSGTWTTVTTDSGGDVGQYTSLAVIDGKPAISYYDSTNGDLKFAHNSEVGGSGKWAVVTVDSDGYVGYETSLAIVDGKPAISYSEGDNGDLKFARNSAVDGSGTWAVVTVDSEVYVDYNTSLAIVDGKPAISYHDYDNGDLKFARNSAVDGSGTWTNIIIDSAGNVGAYTLLAIVGGKPAISYHDFTNGDLKFAHNSAVDGSGTWSLAVSDTGSVPGHVGEYTSHAIVDGKPAISYYDNSNGDLKFARNSEVEGSGTWTTVTVDSAGNVGYYTSLAVVGGKPAISYYDIDSGDLKFARNSAVDGSGTWTNITVDSAGSMSASHTSLAVVNGKPAISYYDNSNGDLKFARNSEVEGSGTWTTVTVHSEGDVGANSSLAVIDGKPAISYLDNTNSDLKFARNNAVDGSGTWTTVTVDSEGNVGEYTSLAIVDGKPAISYPDGTNGDLKFARNSEVEGSGTWTTVTVDSEGNVGAYSSLAVIDGKPAISYLDNTNSDLKFARNNAVDGSGTWTKITVDSEGRVGYYSSLAVIDGKPAISYLDDTNFDLKWARITLPTGPTVTTRAATNIDATSATLNATVNPNGDDTTAKFEYGTTTAYGNEAVIVLASADGTMDQTATANLTSLLPFTTYHFRATATNSKGTTDGTNGTFTTLEASSLIVTTTNDDLASDGKTSLREAIAFANTRTGADVIEFALTGTSPHTIQLTKALPRLESNIVLQGPGANALTVRGEGTIDPYGIFSIGSTSMNGPSVKISGLTISNGASIGSGLGGGILAYYSEVTVDRCVFSGNTAAQSGGAIFTESGPAVRVSNSFFTGNRAGVSGGAIRGPATVANCTFTDNRVTSGSSFDGGGAISGAAPGGPSTAASAVNIVNSTFTNNFAYFGGAVSSPSVTVLNSTFSGNSASHGAALFLRGNTRIGNCIFQRSTSGGNISGNYYGPSHSVGHNISDDTPPGDDPKTANNEGILNHPTDKLNTDARLDTLRSTNGGEVPTMALLPGSLAVDSGDNALRPADDLDIDGDGDKTEPIPFDARGIGFARVKAGRVDIGALEVQNDGPVATDTTLSGVMNTTFSGQLQATDSDTGNTLSYAITSGTLPVGLSLNPATGAITGTPTAPAAGTTVKFTATDNYRATSNEATATFNIKEGPSLMVTTGSDNSTSFDSLTSLREAIAFANSNADMSTVEFSPDVRGTITLTQGELLIDSDLTIEGPGASALRINGNNVNRVFNIETVTVTISGLTISGGNAGVGDGGGIYNRGMLTVSSSTLSSNRANTYGGAIYSSGSLIVSGSTISGNSATYYASSGGGIYNAYRGSLTISRSTLSGNSATTGGGIWNSDSLTISSSTLSGNSVTFRGGGIYNSSGASLTMSGSIVAGNSATNAGPEIYGAVVSGGYNLLGKSDGSSGLTATGDQTGTGAAPLDAKLDTLKSTNGGPTATIALLAGSPAINAGDPNFDGTGKTDQRGEGFPRVRSGRVDIGAFEVQNAAPIATGPSSFLAVQNMAKTVTLSGTDADGDALAYIVTSLPTRGTLYDGADTTKPISIVPYELTGDSHQVTLLSSSSGTGSFGFRVNDGTTSSTQHLVSYSVNDVTAPATPIIKTPAHLSVVKSMPLVNGTASDDMGGSGIGKVDAYLRRTVSGAYQYWALRSGTWDWGASSTPIPTTLASTGAWSVSNTSPAGTTLPSGEKLPSGSYQVFANALDKAGNGKISAINTFKVDVEAPVTVVITSPAHGAGLKTLPSISGTATDNAGGSSIGKVDAYLRRTLNGAYQYWANRAGVWDWGASVTPMPTTLATTGAWGVSNTSPAGTILPSGEKLPSGTYQVFANAFDKAGNAKVSATHTFRIDVEAPSTVVVSTPANGAGLKALPSITGTSSDNTGGSGIGKVDAYLRRTVSGAYQYWANRSGVWDWGASVTPIPATLASNGAWSVSNTSPAGTILPSGEKLPSGSYQVFANAFDKAGNSKISAINTFSVDTTAPASVVVTSPANATKISSLPSISGTSSDNAGGSGIGKVDAYLRRTVSGAYQYWANRAGVWDWGTSSTPIATTAAANGSWSVSNISPEGTTLPSGAKLPSGSYQVFANALDKAGNAKVSAINTFAIVVAAANADSETVTAAPIAEPTESTTTLVKLSSASAQASTGTIRLVFTGTVDLNTAAAPSRYSVSIEGAAISVESVQVASRTTVVLTLEEGAAKAGDVALVSYDIRDTKGNRLSGNTRVTLK
jgi:predicted outer membrane repeat protein